MNSEKIAEFLDRMKVDMYFQSYYLSLYDTLRLLNKRIFDFPLLVVIEAEKKWSLKLDMSWTKSTELLTDVKTRL